MSYFHRSVTSNLGNLLTWRQLFRAMFRPFSIQIDWSVVSCIVVMLVDFINGNNQHRHNTWYNVSVNLSREWAKHRLIQLSSGKQITLVVVTDNMTRHTLSCLNYEYIWWYIWPWILKVGIKFSWITFVAPNDVIWKQLLYCWIWVKKCLESGPLPETNECSGSGASIWLGRSRNTIH